MGNYILPFLYGVVWMIMIGVQTRLLVSNRPALHLLVWVSLTSIISGFTIRSIATDLYAVIPYAVGTGLGAVLSRKIIQ